jgi:pyruvate dehydrogenase E2 component (dihydrolipoamide acetyltransferase)/2-oxoisovalerate dehydrogenase E2 component (dihydrolipoyl transacylase)
MDFSLPQLGEGVYEAEVVRWLVKAGDVVRRGQLLLEVMTDKATMDVPAPFAGTITSLNAESGQRLKVGDVVLSYALAGSEAPAVESAPVAKRAVSVAAGPERPAAPPKPERRTGNGHAADGPMPPGAAAPAAAPSVRHLARKLGVDLAQVRGTGPGGRILVEDLTDFIKRSSREKPPSTPSGDGPALDFGIAGTRVRLQGIRRKIAEHMVTAKRTIPHYSYVDECDLTDLVRLRASLRDAFARNGTKLTYLAFFVRAAVKALQEVPLVNATLDEAASEIVLHDRYHVGFAVATPGGLIVPVIHDADRKDLATIAREVERLSADARAGRSKLEDLRGGTFTLTSIGNIGGLISTPIVNHPEVGILGIGKVVKRPIYDAAGNLRPADLVYLSFSFDHRVVDGAVGAAFGNALIRHLQNPAVLLLPEKWK